MSTYINVKCKKIKHLLSICVSSCGDVVHHVLDFFLSSQFAISTEDILS